MLKEGDKFTVELIGLQVAEDRKVQGALIPEGAGFYWLFTNAGRETELMLTHEAMFAMVQLYTQLITKKITAEATWYVEEKEGAIIATADPTDSGPG